MSLDTHSLYCALACALHWGYIQSMSLPGVLNQLTVERPSRRYEHRASGDNSATVSVL